MIPRYIAVDWGSTNLRAWLFQDDKCLENRQSRQGVTQLEGRSPQAVLAHITQGWHNAPSLVVMAGMVGSNMGWKTVPYLELPVAFDDIGRQLTAADVNTWIIPGLSITRDDNHNIMRGEETQLLGAYHLAPASLYVMPGTHCKWVKADSQRILEFRTAMTGELHHLLLCHSLIGSRLPAQICDMHIYQQGVAQGIHHPGLLPRLFEVRAAHILGCLAAEHVSEYLSGLLIGAEVASMSAMFDHPQSITLIAAPELMNRYKVAFDAIRIKVNTIDGDTAFLSGIRSIIDEMEN